MLVLGIDPGSRHTGYALVEVTGGDLRLLDDGRISPPAKLPLHRRLADLAADLTEILCRWNPTAVAVESPFQGMNARSLIVLSQARGVILGVVGSYDLELGEYSPAEVKKAIAGHGGADKGQVSRMVNLLLGLDGAKRSADQTDAMAIAICYARRSRMDSLATRIREAKDL